MKRGARRNNQRFKQRREQLVRILENEGWIPSGYSFQTNSSIDIYALRAKAASEKVFLEELAKVLYMLNGKRGYQSNRKANNEDEEGTDYIEKIRARDRELIDRNITIGQKHQELLQENAWAKLKERTYSRKSYRNEFDQIWSTQQQFHSELTDSLRFQVGERTLFYQRPLRSQKGLISKCTFETQRRVAPKSSPVFQEFKIWQQLHSLRLNDEAGGEKELNIEDKKALFQHLNDRGKMTVSQLKKFLGLKTNDPLIINFPHLEGNYTRSALLKVLEETGYDTHEILDLDLSIEGNDFDKQPFMKLWHLLYAATDQESLIQNLIKVFGFTDDQAKAVAGVRLVQDYGSLSVRAMRKILPHLAEGHRYDEAAALAGYRHSNYETKEEQESRPLKDRLDVIQKGKLRNPVVEKILNQLIHVINEILSNPKLGRPDEIRVELARELKSSAKQRQLMTTNIAKNTRENEQLKKRLIEEFKLSKISRNDILKLKLFEECGGRSLYTGQPISVTKLFSTDEYDIDHIIPQSRLFDDSQGNKILCESWINREKGNMTAWDYIQSRGPNEVDRYLKDIEFNMKMTLGKKLKLRMGNENVPDDFIERQLRESQYIVKHAFTLLTEVCRNVTSTTGIITAHLRNEWGLAHIMQELNLERYQSLGRVKYRELQSGKRLPVIDDWSKRDDHRHHAVDALVVACTSQSIVQKLNTLNQRFEGLERVDKSKIEFPTPWPGFRNDASLGLKNILISFKGRNKVSTRNTNRTKAKGKGKYNYQTALTPRGPLHKETIYAQKQYHEKYPVPLNKKFDRPDQIINPELRRLVTDRWAAYDNNPAKAAASLKNDPIMYLGKPVEEVKCWRHQFTIRKDVGPDLKLDKILDIKVYNILLQRLEEHDGDKKKAFSDLENNPIWFDEDRRIPIKKVTLEDNGDLTPLRHNGQKPIDFVYTRNNHHAAIFKGPDDKRALEMVSFYEAVERQRLGLPVYSETNAEGWPLEFTLQINDYFLFDINPEEVDILNPTNRHLVSKNLFRVQKLSAKPNGGPDFVFRHHLETTLKNDDEFGFRRITSFKNLNGIKVIVNRLGHIDGF